MNGDRPAAYSSLDSVLERLAAPMSPEEILALRPGSELQARLDFLLQRSRMTGHSTEEQREWDQYERVEHLVRLAKISAMRQLNAASPASPSPETPT